MDMDRPVCNTNQHLLDTLTYRAGLQGVYTVLMLTLIKAWFNTFTFFIALILSLALLLGKSSTSIAFSLLIEIVY